jgi:putative inorganic carbon (HCO3(-)) transporter
MDVTLPQVLRLLTGMGLFLALTNNAHFIAKRVSLVAAGVALLGVMLVFSMPFTVEWSGASKFAFIPPALYRGFTLIVSDGINPNVMAGAIVLLLPVAFAQLFKSSPPARRVFFALVVLILFAGLMLAGSRSALFAAVSTGFVLLIIQLPRKFTGVLVAVSGLAAVLLVASSQLFETQISAAVNGLLTSNDALSGSLSRMEIWSRAIYIIQDFPFTGIGMGLFAPVTDLLYPMIITRPGIEHAHNLILQIAVDLGLPGLVAWLALYFVVMACLLTQMRRKSFMDKSWVVGLLGAQVALILGGITDAVTWGMVRSAPLVWGLWGLAVASWLSSSQHDNTMD